MKIPFHFICAGLISILAATILPAHVIDPGLLKTLRDSGSKDALGRRIGYWVEYQVDSTHETKYMDIDGTRKQMADTPHICITRLSGMYSDGKRTGEWKVYQCFSPAIPVTWNLWEIRPYRNSRYHGWLRHYAWEGNLLFKSRFRDGSSHGDYFEYYPDGKVRAALKFRENYMQGEQKYFFESGKLRSEMTFNNGYVDGHLKAYYENGKLGGDFIYRQGALWEQKACYRMNGQPLPVGTLKEGVGTVNFYNNLGRLQVTYTYRYGKREGQYREYRKDGSLMRIGNYSNGEISGKETWYDRDGNVMLEANIDNGVYNGSYTYFYRNGKVWTERIYKEGKLWNVLSVNDTNGKPLDPGTFKDGNGILKTYDDSMRPMYEYTYRDGMRNGPYRKFYKSGKLHIESAYRNDTLDGVEKVYLENGVKIRESQISGGLYHGTSRAWFFNGIPKHSIEYSYGRPWNIYFCNDTNGATTKGGTLKNGFGTLIYYSDSGRLKSIYEYKYGLANGKRTEYYPDGKLFAESTFVNDTIEGFKYVYYPNGNLKFKTNFEHGVKTGHSFVYHQNGQLWTERVFYYTYLWNVLSNYDANGQKMDPGTIKDGNGTVNEYDEQGILKAAHKVVNGYVPDWQDTD